MSDINAMAQDIAIETGKQGEKLQGLDHNMAIADENTSKALKELTEAQMHQRKSGRCMYFLVSVIVLALLVIIISSS